MAPPTNHGPISWGMARDNDGYRTYHITHLVETANYNAGPLTAFSTPNLPLTGDTWDYGEDIDGWAFCQPKAVVKVSRRQEVSEKGRYWEVTNTFSTKPLERCQDTDVEDPLLEPQKVSGSFTQSNKLATKDRFDKRIESSSHEPIPLEVSINKPTVVIGQNVSDLELDVFSEMVNTVNDDTLWGLSERKVKLANVSWSRNYYGVCSVYYTRTFEFEIDFTTHDETLVDYGTLHVIEGEDASNPKNFEQNKDDNDENLGVKRPLDGAGNIVALDDAAVIEPEYYEESNFLLLGIPTTL